MMMMPLSRLLTFTVLWVTVARAAHGCPHVCFCDGVTVDCSRQDLVNIPVDLPANVSDLILRDNDIGWLDGGALSQYSHLQNLDLRNNTIEGIDTGTFYNLTRLRRVVLQDNHLQYIAESAFELVDLQELDLRGNRGLRQIASNAFVNVTIVALDLSRCNLTFVHRRTFASMQNTLKVFILNDNGAALDLDHSLFEGFQLDSLKLVNSTVSAISFFGGAKAEILELSHNPLGNDVWLHQWQDSGVRELYLAGVGLTHVNISQPWHSLAVLELADNALIGLRSEDFRHTPNLNGLILSNTMLEGIPLGLGGYLSSLLILALSSNAVRSLEVEHLDGLNLKLLDLNNNLIQSLDKQLEATFSNLTELKLEGNIFHCNCEMKWFHSWIRSLRATETKVFASECATPEEYKGPLLRMRSSDFRCESPLVLSIAPPRIRDGDDVPLKCRGRGDPPPGLHLETPWGKEVWSEPHSNKSLETVELVHIVHNYNCTLDGQLVCTATNIAGQAIQESSLVSTCIPLSTNDPELATDDYYRNTDEYDDGVDNSATTDRNDAHEEEQNDDDDDDDNNSITIIIILVVTGLVIVVLLAVIGVCWRHKVMRAYHVSPKKVRRANQKHVNKDVEESQAV